MAMKSLVLAIDLGSSWCKAAYLDGAGRFVATGRAYTRSIAPSRDAMLPAFWQTLCEAVRNATAQLPVAVTPAAIGISCRAQFGVCLDVQGAAFWPMADCQLQRDAPELQQAYAPARWGDQDPYAFGYGVRMAAMIAWLRQQQPDEWRRIHRVGALHNYLVYRLAGVWVSDPTSGAEQPIWPDAILDLTGLPPTAFPRILPAQAVVGGLLPAAADALALPVGTPVIVGMHDGAAANLGTGAVQAGDACLTLGTNFVFRAVTGARLLTQCFAYTVAPGRWAWVNNVPSASTQFDLVAECLRPALPSLPARHQVLGQMADDVPPGANGLFLKRLVPGAEAQWQTQLQALPRAGYADGAIYRALAEAIAFGVHDLVQTAMRDGVRPLRLIATGGSAQNRHFLHVLSAVLKAPIAIGAAEAGLLGVGMAAAVASGWYPTVEAAMTPMITPGPLVYPDPAAMEFYQCFLQGMREG